ncbi:MAG TPA: AMP-binding protein [Solimonas sp.]|nr:AMP-binding protein [Solimonas sp.]
MSRVLAAIAAHARSQPKAIALEAREARLSYAELEIAIEALARTLTARGFRTVALLADNGLGWALADLAALRAGLRLVPLPPFFSPRQMAHALRSAGAEAVLVDPRLALNQQLSPLPAEPLSLGYCGTVLSLQRLPAAGPAPQLPEGTCKITYTSGTTGEPKGVCLGAEEMERVAAALAQASRAVPGDRHLGVLPLSTLLENLGGLYAPLLAGATACLWPMAEVGLRGAAGLDVRMLREALDVARASSAILVPQMLQALVEAIEAGLPRPPHLRFVAVGGAPLAPRLLQRAQALGLPVFEGYGLSECASVIALSTPDAQRAGSVGRPLPHVRLEFAADGEILVSGNGFRGYVGEPPRDPQAPVPTGDIGYLDSNGFLCLTGRKKNMFVTAFGRNVAPEWVERELCLHPAIAQAAVFGEARPWNTAVIVPRAGQDMASIAAAIEAVNAELPDYARIRRWLPATQAFTPANGQLTPNGRLRRASILAQYGAAIESLYEETSDELL